MSGSHGKTHFTTSSSLRSARVLPCLVFAMLAVLFSLLLVPTRTARAAAKDGEIDTEIFLPTSYLQYYKLDSPYAICRYDDGGKDFVAISHKNAIVVYRDEKFSSIRLTSINGQVKSLARYGKFLLFVYDLEIYTVDLTDFEDDGWAAVPVSTGIMCSAFSIRGDVLVTATSDNIYFNEVDPAADEFTLSAERVRHFTAVKPSSVLYSADGKVYFNCTDTSSLFEYDPLTGLTSEIVSGYPGVRCIAEDDAGAKLYYSCDGGLFSMTKDTGAISTLFEIDGSNAEADLGNLLNPTGICLTGRGVWVVDATINAVQEIDLDTKNFTKFAITTNSSAVNRLTADARDVCVDKDKIYALDSDRIVVVNDIDGENSYNRVTLNENGNAKCFAAGGGYVCYANSVSVKLLRLTDVGEPDMQAELVKTVSKAPSSDNDFNDVIDICYSEGTFYILRNILNNGETYPALYTLDAATGEAKKTDVGPTSVGVGRHIATDIFGTVYFVSKNAGFYEFFSYDGNSLKKLHVEQADGEIKNLQTDFDGKLYALYEGNRVECYDGDEVVFSKTLRLSPNLVGVGDSKSMCLSYNSRTAYFIFSGLILNSSVEEQLEIATPYRIGVPDGFALNHDASSPFVNIADRARMFSVDVSDLGGPYFGFLGYGSSEGEIAGYDYAAVDLDDKYTLVIADGIAAIVRDTDVANTFYASPLNDDGYAAVDFKPYIFPVLTAGYGLDEIEKFSHLDVVAEVTFNGENYYAVVFGEHAGYIPDRFVLPFIAAESPTNTITSAYIRGGVNVFAERGLVNKIDVIPTKTKVIVLADLGGVLKISYDGGKTGYVSATHVVSDGKANVIKALIIIMVALSMTVTALFLEDRMLYGEKPVVPEAAPEDLASESPN